eukprot:gene21191-32637_t
MNEVVLSSQAVPEALKRLKRRAEQRHAAGARVCCTARDAATADFLLENRANPTVGEFDSLMRVHHACTGLPGARRAVVPKSAPERLSIKLPFQQPRPRPSEKGCPPRLIADRRACPDSRAGGKGAQTGGMSHDPYADFADDDEENALPSLSDCAPGLEEVFPPGPAKSSSYATGHMPMNALNTDRSVAYWSQEDDLEPRWTSRISKVPIAVSLVVVHAAHEDAGKGPADMKHIVVELLLTKDDEDKKVWVSPIMSVADATDSERLIVYCPAVLATKIAVVKRSPMLGLRTVQLFAVPLRRYKLSRTILTIDKFAVPQPFSLAELASSTAYSNLLTSSAGPALGNQESFVAEKEHEALSLVQHLSGIYDSETREFTHDAKTKPALFQYIISVMEQAKRLFASEPPLIDVRGPCYVFGDIHGNFGDLSYFMSNLIPFKHIRYCSHNFLFLGDYVDRGAYDVECLAYLCSLKIQAPDKIFLLRGNHEDRRQNASMSESFYNHCIKLFGSESGKELWARANDLFDMLPLCAVIENKIFCCHGGVPRVPKADSGVQMRIRDVLRKIPRPWSV